VPALIFVPVIAGLVVAGVGDGVSALETVLLVAAGLALWTLAEYWLHRKLFHWEPDNAIGRRMHFIIHGVHHDHPNDRMRLVMPPGASIPLAALFFGGLSNGAAMMQLFSDIPLDLVNVLSGTVMIFAVLDFTRIRLLRRAGVTPAVSIAPAEAPSAETGPRP